MHHSPSYAGCVPCTGTWTAARGERRGAGQHFLLVLVLAILTALAACGVALWYYLNSWISLPLL